jgi:hypothetical protein
MLGDIRYAFSGARGVLDSGAAGSAARTAHRAARGLNVRAALVQG